MTLIKTTIEFDIKHFLSNESLVTRIAFTDIEIYPKGIANKLVKFTVNKLTPDVEQTVIKTDADGNKIILHNIGDDILDAQGNPTGETYQQIDYETETKVDDLVEFLYRDEETITNDEYYAMADYVNAQLPADTTLKDRDEAIKREGFKLFLINGKYGKGKFTSQADFE